MGTQIMPATSASFLHDSVPFNPNIYSSDFGDPASGQTSFYHNDLVHQQQYLISPQMLLTDTNFQRGLSQSPVQQSRNSIYRHRTPIRHHRQSTTRARSRSRSEALMAYAGRQGDLQLQPTNPSVTIVPSQSAPTTPQNYPMASYPMGGARSNYLGGLGYFSNSTSIQPSSTLSEFGALHSEGDYNNYDPSSRRSSRESGINIAHIDPEEGMYMQGQQHQQALDSFQTMEATQQAFPPIPRPLESSPGDVEVMMSRPKPQCWDHGCNGRQFSTFSNLLRHQREKGGSATKSVCPHCGTEFTRTTARNGHMYGGKCKGRPEQENKNQVYGASDDEEKGKYQQGS